MHSYTCAEVACCWRRQQSFNSHWNWHYIILHKRYCDV